MNHVKLVDFDYVHWFTEVCPLYDGKVFSQNTPTEECVLFINYIGDVKVSTHKGTLIAIGQTSYLQFIDPADRRLCDNVRYSLTEYEAANLYGLFSMAGL